MHIRYVGFDHADDLRFFHFDVMRDGATSQRCSVRADLRLFPKYQLGIQEAPGLCGQKLHQNLSAGIAEGHELTAVDLNDYVERRKKAEDLRAASRKSRRDIEEYQDAPGGFATAVSA